jgi:hypothetical protein
MRCRWPRNSPPRTPIRGVAQDVARPELLPVRLARACIRVLPVAGVGISMFGTEGIRIPIGASDEDAANAERLQFTAAEGPCLDAHALARSVLATETLIAHRSVLATETLIAQRWPDFHAGLLARPRSGRSPRSPGRPL